LPGLFGINFLYKIPVAGYLIRLAVGLVQIPTIASNISKMEAYTHWRFSQGEATVNQTQDIVSGLRQTKADNVTVSRLAESVRQLETGKADQEQVADLNNSVAQLDLSKADQEHMEKLSVRITQLDRVKAEGTIVRKLGDSVQQLEAAQAALLDRIELLDRNKANSDIVSRLRQQLGPLEWQQIQRQFEELQSHIVDHMRNILNNQRNIALLLEEARKKIEEPLTDEQIIALLDKDEHVLDGLLVSFLDVFRGSRDEIKRRQSIYLPIVQEVCAGVEDAQVLDVGCGRGEWLELLKEQQLTGIGIDFNSVLVKECTERNLQVIEAEALQYLRQLPPDSVAAVTCFHIIEHLPFLMMIKLFDEAFRVVKTGGVVIFETPNPENLLVGACTFYLDPTHHNPLPPELTKYLLASRGFSRVEIKRLHPYPESSKITGAETDLINRLNDLLYGFQDYAVIGYKDQVRSA
jgi:O-antigen chain-terminating methyltransferase